MAKMNGRVNIGELATMTIVEEDKRARFDERKVTEKDR